MRIPSAGEDMASRCVVVRRGNMSPREVLLMVSAELLSAEMVLSPTTS